MSEHAVSIRPFVEGDLDEIVRLSLVAWAPVFHSFEEVLGPEVYLRLYPDWRAQQRESVIKVCTEEGAHVLVAEVDGGVAGFLAYKLREEESTAEVLLLAVHPDLQNGGIGTALNVAALEEMKAAGIQMAVVETGGEESHAPARRSYEKTGYTPLPLVRYFKRLKTPLDIPHSR
ncbi:MAG: GNAT family N-acetyltransferase [Anaerolineae bacterium]|nr:GNAT family N-acetyltransferase [Anaerolineae bacterium]